MKRHLRPALLFLLDVTKFCGQCVCAVALVAGGYIVWWSIVAEEWIKQDSEWDL